MTTFIYADNYRGFADALIPINHVNFLVGENSTGKSSFLELVETFSQVQFWVIDPVFGLPGVEKKHFLDLVSASATSKDYFSIGALQIAADSKTITRGMIVTYKDINGRPTAKRVSIVQKNRIRTIEGELWNSEPENTCYGRSVIRRSLKDKNSNIDIAKQYIGMHHSDTKFSALDANSQILRAPLFMRFHQFLYGTKEFSDADSTPPFPFARKFVDLAPIRTKPRRTYDAPQTEFSPEGDHIPYVIRKTLADTAKSDGFKKFLKDAGRSSGLFQSIGIKEYGDDPLAPFEMKVLLGDIPFSLQNVGYGVSQALPVFVELFVRPKRTAFTVQQPEVHLHPRAQATFGDVIAELARMDDKVFFIETHSDFTIDRFRLNVRKNGGKTNQILFFERTDSGNHATSISILKNGDLSPDQPDSYRDFFLNESLSQL